MSSSSTPSVEFVKTVVDEVAQPPGKIVGLYGTLCYYSMTAYVS